VTKDHYSEQEAKQALQHICVAIKYCHDQNIVHRDLKPENILYSTPDEDSMLKIADFGLATLVRPNQLMTVACGTPGYVAPEILRGIAYGKEVDIWSIGVILYILLCGFPPFYDDNNKKLFSQIVNAQFSFPDPYWTNISPMAKDLVSQLLVVDPKKRLTADEILRHPWMFEDGRGTNLDHFRPNMKSFNAKRRLKSAIRAVQITQLLRNRTTANRLQSSDTKDPSILEVVETGDAAVRSKSIDNSDLTNNNPHSMMKNVQAAAAEVMTHSASDANTPTSTTPTANAANKGAVSPSGGAVALEKIEEATHEHLSPSNTFTAEHGVTVSLSSPSKDKNDNAAPVTIANNSSQQHQHVVTATASVISPRPIAPANSPVPNGITPGGLSPRPQNSNISPISPRPALVKASS